MNKIIFAYKFVFHTPTLNTLKNLNLPALIFLILLNMLVGCNKEDNVPPICRINFPTNGDEIEQGETVFISVFADDADGTISEVQFNIDGSVIGTLKNPAPHIGTVQIQELPMKQALQPFREVLVLLQGHSEIWVATVSGGVLTRVEANGMPGSCERSLAM